MHRTGLGPLSISHEIVTIDYNNERTAISMSCHFDVTYVKPIKKKKKKKKERKATFVLTVNFQEHPNFTGSAWRKFLRMNR